MKRCHIPTSLTTVPAYLVYALFIKLIDEEYDSSHDMLRNSNSEIDLVSLDMQEDLPKQPKRTATGLPDEAR